MSAVTKARCEFCGLWCYWNAFDLQWCHMGWTVNDAEQPPPHRPVVPELPPAGGMALEEGPDE